MAASIKSIKYVTKYVTKNRDHATFTLETDEISDYLNARYLSCIESN